MNVRSTEWHERRRGALYCIIFLYSIQHTKFCIVSKQNRREIAHFEQKGKTSREGREVEENAMEWLLRNERKKNNSNNNIRKFILKAYSIYFFSFFLSFFLFPFEIFIFLRIACCCSFQTSLCTIRRKHSTRLGKKTLFSSYKIKYKIICLDCSGKINSTCSVRFKSNEFEFYIISYYIFFPSVTLTLPRLFVCLFFFVHSFHILPSKIRIANPHHVSGTLFVFQMERKNISE